MKATPAITTNFPSPALACKTRKQTPQIEGKVVCLTQATLKHEKKEQQTPIFCWQRPSGPRFYQPGGENTQGLPTQWLCDFVSLKSCIALLVRPLLDRNGKFLCRNIRRYGFCVLTYSTETASSRPKPLICRCGKESVPTVRH